MFPRIISQQESKQLFRWNAIMGTLHFIQGIFMWVVSNDLTRPLIWNLPAPEIGERYAILTPETWLNLDLGKTIAVFLLASAVAHYITILPKVFPWYLEKLSKHQNLIRWWEYGISSSLMVVVIAALCNITDAATMILLFSINTCMNFFGAMMEKHNSALKEHAKNYEELSITMGNKKLDMQKSIKSSYITDWTSFWYGIFAGVIPWVIMGVYFFITFARLNGLDSLPQQVKDILSTVQWVFPILFVFFNFFAINMYLQYKRTGKWKDYLWGEKVYIILSLLAKSFLAWFIWAGTMER